MHAVNQVRICDLVVPVVVVRTREIPLVIFYHEKALLGRISAIYFIDLNVVNLLPKLLKCASVNKSFRNDIANIDFKKIEIITLHLQVRCKAKFRSFKQPL